MKKTILYIVCAAMVLAAACAAVACKKPAEKPGGIIDVGEEPAEQTLTLSESSLTMVVGDTQLLTATYTAVQGQTLTFTSGDPAVAAVSADGTVTAVRPGSAQITAAYGELRATCAVSVSLGGYLPALGFVSGKDEYALTVGDRYTLTPQIRLGQKTFDDAAVTYTSSDDAVVSVAGNTLTAVKTGTVTVTASAVWRGMDQTGYDTLRASFCVTVKNSVLFSVNGGAARDVQLYTVSEVPGFTGTYDTQAEFVPSVSVNGEEKTPDVTVGDDAVVAYAAGRLTAVGYGTTTVILSYEVDRDVVSEPAITVTVERPTVIIDERVQNFSADKGGYRDAADGYAVKMLGSLVSPDGTYRDAYQEETEISIDEDGRLSGLTLSPDAKTTTSITLGTDTVLYKFAEVEAYGGILTGKEDLYIFNRTVNVKPLVGYFVLLNDIDMDGYDFKAASNITVTTYGMDLWGTTAGNTNYFQGTFEGNGHTIKNFKSTGSITVSAGFFGAVYNNSTIRNVAFTGVTSAECGRVLATGLGSNVTIENVYVEITGAVTGKPVGALGTQVGTGLTIRNVVVDMPVTAAYENEDYPRGTLIGGNGADWKGATITDTYVYGGRYPIIVGYNSQGIGYAGNETEDTWDKTLSGGNAVRVQFAGVGRYDSKGAMSAEATLDLSSFDNGYWGVEAGVPVFGSAGRGYTVYVDGALVDGQFDAQAENSYTVTARAFTAAECTLESDGAAVTVSGNTFTFVGTGTATVTVRADGEIIGSFTVQAARERVTVTDDADYSVRDGKIVSTRNADWFGSADYTIVSATLAGSPLTVTDGRITGITSSYNRQKVTLADGTTVDNGAPENVGKLSGALVITTDTHVVTFESVYAYDGVIITADRFVEIFDIDEAGKTVDGFYVLGADIDMTGKTLGHSAILSDVSPCEYSKPDTTGFHGIFDGRGHTISGFTAGAGGLFGKFAYGTMNSSWDNTGHGSAFYQTAVVRNVAVQNVDASAGPVLARSVNAHNVFNIQTSYLTLIENVHVSYAADCTAVRGLIAHYRPAVRMHNVVVDASAVPASVVSGLPSGANKDAPESLLGSGTLFGSVGQIAVRFPNLTSNETSKATLVKLNEICYENVYVIAPETLKVGQGYGTDGTYLYNCAGVAANRLPADVTLASAADYTAANIAADVGQHYYIFTTVYQYATGAELVDTDSFNADAMGAYWTVTADGLNWKGTV